MAATLDAPAAQEATVLPHAARQEAKPQLDAGRAARLYATRAVALLRQAAAKGYNDLDALQGDKDLDPLRERADFKQLRAELEAKRKTESK